MKYIVEVLKKVKKAGLYPEVKVIEGVSSLPEVIINGQRYLQFSSANYLGLTTNSEIIQAIKNGLDQYGIHPTGSRLISGTQDIHIKLERNVAAFKKTESAMVLPGGVVTNIGVIPALTDLPLASFSTYLKHLLGRKTVIFSDEFNHASIIDGIRLSKAKVEVYRHSDMGDLEDKVSRHSKERKLIISDGVFSMNGDIAKIPEIVRIAKRHDAMTMIDDAHGVGILGQSGRGTVEHFGLSSKDIDVNMGTFSKAFGVVGGFIAGNSELVEYLRISTRTYVFTGGLLGGLASGVLKSLEIIENGDSIRQKLWRNTKHLQVGLRRLGFDTLESVTPIIPILIGREALAIDCYNELFNKGIFAPCFRWPAVKRNEAIIRFTMTALHETHQIDFLLNVLGDIGRKIKII